MTRIGVHPQQPTRERFHTVGSGVIFDAGKASKPEGEAAAPASSALEGAMLSMIPPDNALSGTVK